MSQSQLKDIKITNDTLDLLCEYFKVYISELSRQAKYSYQIQFRNSLVKQEYNDATALPIVPQVQYQNQLEEKMKLNNDSQSTKIQIDFSISQRPFMHVQNHQEYKELKSYVQDAFLDQKFTNCNLIPGIEFMGEENNIIETTTNDQVIKDFALGEQIFRHHILTDNVDSENKINLIIYEGDQHNKCHPRFQQTNISKHIISPQNEAKIAQEFGIGDFVFEQYWQSKKGSDKKL